MLARLQLGAEGVDKTNEIGTRAVRWDSSGLVFPFNFFRFLCAMFHSTLSTIDAHMLNGSKV